MQRRSSLVFPRPRAGRASQRRARALWLWRGGARLGPGLSRSRPTARALAPSAFWPHVRHRCCCRLAWGWRCWASIDAFALPAHGTSRRARCRRWLRLSLRSPCCRRCPASSRARAGCSTSVSLGVDAADLAGGRSYPRHRRAISPGTAPRRGDVAAFRFPRDPGDALYQAHRRLPGDTRADEERQSPRQRRTRPDRARRRFLRYAARIARYGRYPSLHRDTARRAELPHHPRLRPADCSRTPDLFTVPPDHYFMLGDNRDDSEDSRDPASGVGFVPATIWWRARCSSPSRGAMAPRWWRRLRWRRTAHLLQ